ncbi:hypothetical protein AeMF1_014526 [Aphanomyces euteiches]|nr:hypothetical protein AeMF1_014526 [Aphanomyces euteiches]KAH9168303.1 hypothetical protein AeNC1_017956 [Aphanomyces euteiches]
MPMDLFTPLQVGSVRLANRVLMPPHTRIRAGPTHVPNDLMKEYYAQRASAGLIIAECSMIAPKTSAFYGEPGVYTQEQLVAWKSITDAVHAKGGKMFMQIWHSGRAAHPIYNDGAENVGPSAIAIDTDITNPLGFADEKLANATPRPLDIAELHALAQLYATAAKNCVDVAGFDGVEIHAANGYLIDSFLRESDNTRTDQYGGSLENRTRFLSDVLGAVTAAIGADKVGIRFSPLNSYNSMKTDDPLAFSEAVAKLSQQFDLAYVHVMRDDFFRLQKADVVPIFRQHFKNALIVNMGYTKDEANAGIAAGLFDAVTFGTPFIANPDLPLRFQLDAPLNTPDTSTFYVGGANGYTDYPFLSRHA